MGSSRGSQVKKEEPTGGENDYETTDRVPKRTLIKGSLTLQEQGKVSTKVFL